jgi:hypothetical protein
MKLTRAQKILIAEAVGAFLITREVADRMLKGKVTKAEMNLLGKIVRTSGRIAAREVAGLGRLAVRGAPVAARGLALAARTNPYSLAATLAIAGYIKREEIADVARAVADDPRVQEVYEDVLAGAQTVTGTMREAAIHTYGPDLAGLSPGRGLAKRFIAKRKTSRANTAVKQAMKWLKGGSRSTTGAAAGKLPKNAFKTAVKAAGMANPKTKSKPGKGKSIMNKLARRLKKWW